MHFDDDLEHSLSSLRSGGIILYPTDTVWGLGCDATNPAAVAKIYALKQRAESKSMIVLLADDRDILSYVASPDPAVFDYLETADRPTTIIYDHAIGVADNLVAEDGSIGIRVVKDEFCRHLLKRFRKPLVSTSANISGRPSPASFADIEPAIREGVDYVVQHRQRETARFRPSRIIRWRSGQAYEVIRE